jgi:2-C-methyl-D-erythritol 4-phosphate cytidylyltransferase
VGVAQGSPTVGVAIPAAGTGSRMGGRKKQFLELAAVPVLLRSLRPFLELPAVASVVVALPEGDLADPPTWLTELDPRVNLVRGGATRTESVGAAVRALPDSVEVIAVHDAARPLVTGEIIERCLGEVTPSRGAVAGWPAVDTLKETDEESRIVSTPPRDRIWHAQTPQLFPRDLLVRAYEEALREGIHDTDDSALVERIGGEVIMVPGSPQNIKVTRPEDIRLAELLLSLQEG